MHMACTAWSNHAHDFRRRQHRRPSMPFLTLHIRPGIISAKCSAAAISISFETGIEDEICKGWPPISLQSFHGIREGTSFADCSRRTLFTVPGLYIGQVIQISSGLQSLAIVHVPVLSDQGVLELSSYNLNCILACSWRRSYPGVRT